MTNQILREVSTKIMSEKFLNQKHALKNNIWTMQENSQVSQKKNSRP